MSIQSPFADAMTETPALVYQESEIQEALRSLNEHSADVGCKVLFTLKPFVFVDALRLMVRQIDGFSVSSLFEARLAREVVGYEGIVQITTPGLRDEEITSIAEVCDYISFNSLPQWLRLRASVGGTKLGLRINPQLSVVKDSRYNPCGRHSKLGVPLDRLTTILKGDPTYPSEISGLHIHTNCDSSDFTQLLRTVEHIDASLGDFLSRLSWINLGGGYIFDEAKSLEPFYEAVDLLRSKYGLEVFIEPGASIVRKAGYLVSTVLDLFTSDGKEIAILDTTVNHMPEVFEYQYRPEVIGHVDGAAYEYILAGCSCLAGDLFGEYAFAEPLEVGSRVVFSDAGAYTLVKAHMFNGINLPPIYALKENGDLEMKKRFTYEDFASRCGVDTNVFV